MDSSRWRIAHWQTWGARSVVARASLARACTNPHATPYLLHGRRHARRPTHPMDLHVWRS